MKINKCDFGTLADGQKVQLYTISNGFMSFSATDYGCIITDVSMPDKNGNVSNIVLGFSTLEGYVNSCGPNFGAIVGRFANRIGGASYNFGNKKIQLDANDNENCLHGGYLQFSKLVWNSKIINKIFINGKKICGAGICFSRLSKSMEQGFPGNLSCSVSYFLTDDNELVFSYSAVSDEPTPVNFTNHSYFNLGSNRKINNIYNTEIKLFCKKILEIDDKLIPTGNILDVEGTPFDFISSKKIGADIHKTDCGYDHCFVTSAYENCKKNGMSVTNESSPLVSVASVVDSESGRCMDVSSNQEGVQFYTANWIEGIMGKNGSVYHNHEAFCLETQCFPDSPNKKIFPSCILEPSKKYCAQTIYKFTF